MSRENVEVVERVYEAFNHHDADALAQVLAEDFEWHPNPEDPEQDVRRGYADAVAAMKELWEGLVDLHTEPTELIDAGESVAALVHHTARMPASDALIERSEAHVWTLRDKRIVRFAEFATRVEALEAVGLRQ